MTLKSFYLEKAKYKISDSRGNQINLVINYWDGGYEIKYLKVTSLDTLEYINKKAKQIALKLLGKKHRVNFAYKFKKG